MNHLRVWNIINPPSPADFYDVASPDEARKLINKLTQEQLRDTHIVSNVFGLEEEVNGEWEEWYNEEGTDILGLEE
jgi:hypothetical protein